MSSFFDFLPIVTAAAIIDSINFCAFSVLLLTIAFLFSAGNLRAGIVKIGGFYIAGIFLVYVLIGLGIMQMLHFFNAPHFMAKIGALILILFGGINVINEFFPAVAKALTGKPAEFTPADHDAAKVTTGTIDPARLPAVLFAAPVISSGAIADLTAPQQAEISGGTSVVTTDGREWRYTGTGDKTLEASYVEMADRTPDWSTIAGKPATFAPSAHTHTLSDITDAGTMASQAASAVAITGGTINNIVLDGGTF